MARFIHALGIRNVGEHSAKVLEKSFEGDLSLLMNATMESLMEIHEIGDIIIRLNKEKRLTILLVEQKLPFARRVAQNFCILDKGRSVAADEMENLGEEIINRHLTV